MFGFDYNNKKKNMERIVLELSLYCLDFALRVGKNTKNNVTWLKGGNRMVAYL